MALYPTFDREEAFRLFATGAFSYGSLAAHMGVPRTKIKRLISRRAPHLKPGSRPLAYDHDEAVRLYATGEYSYAELAQRYGVNKRSVSDVVKAKAPHLKNLRTRPPAFDHAEAIRLYATGEYDFKSLAAHLDVSVANLRDVIRRKAPELPIINLKRRRAPADVIRKAFASGQYSRAELYTLYGGTWAELHQILKGCSRRTRKVDPDEVVAAYAGGNIGYRRLAAEKGVSESTIRGILRKNCPELLPGGSNLPKYDHFEAISALKSDPNATYGQIAEKYGVASVSFEQMVRRKAPEMLIRRWRPQLRRETILSVAFDTSLSYAEIAEKCDYSPITVQKIIRDHARTLMRGNVGRPRRYDRDEIIALLESGTHNRDTLQRELGIPSSSLDNIIGQDAPHLRYQSPWMNGFRQVQAKLQIQALMRSVEAETKNEP